MINKEFSAGPSPELDIHVHSGRVEIRVGEPGVVKVEVETNDPGFVVEQRGDLIYVSSDETTRWLSRGSSFVSIATPGDTDATVATATAKLETRGRLGNVVVKTASGDVEVDAAKSFVLKSASGDARIGDVSGDMKVSSASGDVILRSGEGKVSFSSASGDVEIQSLAGPVTGSTASGDISIERFEGKKASFKSMSGAVEVGIPAGTQLDLDATLLSGELEVVTSDGSDRVSTGAQVSMKAKLVSGDLTIRAV